MLSSHKVSIVARFQLRLDQEIEGFFMLNQHQYFAVKLLRQNSVEVYKVDFEVQTIQLA